MLCYKCCDKGIIPFYIKKWGLDYEYLARCNCSEGEKYICKVFPPAEAVFTQEEMRKIIEINKKRSVKNA